MDDSNRPWFLTVVYASPKTHLRYLTSKDLSNISSTMNSPWAVASDFNSMIFEKEKQERGPINTNSTEQFWECIQRCSLVDMRFSGQLFIWVTSAPL